MPYLKYIFSKSISKVKACAEKIDAFLESEIKDHMATYQDGHHRDFIDAFLDEIFRREKSKDNPELFQGMQIDFSRTRK